MSQRFLQGLAGPTQTSFDRIHRTPQGVGELLVAQPLNLSEREDHSRVGREARQDPLRKLSICDGWGSFRVPQELVELLTVFFQKGVPRFGLLAAAPPQEVVAMVRRNPIEPRRKGGLAPKRRERLIGFEENLLGGVFG